MWGFESVCRHCPFPSIIFIANTISDNLWCAAHPEVSTRHFSAGLLLVCTLYRDKPHHPQHFSDWKLLISACVLVISKEIKCSLSTSCCAHVFVSVHSDASGFIWLWDSSPWALHIEIVSKLQRIFGYPTGQGAALQANHPPSISLPDWQPSIWLKTKSVNNNWVCKTKHFSHEESHAAPHTLCQFEVLLLHAVM